MAVSDFLSANADPMEQEGCNLEAESVEIQVEPTFFFSPLPAG
jgi:hypothetical protein